MNRNKGPLFVKGSGLSGQGPDKDILDHNTPPLGQPGLWCQWIPFDDGTALEWDGGEKFYNSPQWMKYIIENLLSEKAADYIEKHIDEDERLKDFTCNHIVNGEINAQGEDPDDRWILVVEDNVVKIALSEVTYKEAKPL